MNKVYGFPENLWLRLLDGGWNNTRDVEVIVKILNEMGIDGGKILDLGCGIGRVSLRLAEKGYEVLGIDLSKLCIERARILAKEVGMGSNVRFIPGDYFNLEDILGEEKFDTFLFILSTNWSDRRSKEKLQNLYLKLHKYAKENSVIIIQDICRELLLSAVLSAPTALNWFESDGNLLYLNKWKLNLTKIFSIKEIYEKEGDCYKLLERIERCSYLPSIYDYVEALERAGWEVIKVTRPFLPNFNEPSCNPWGVYSFLVVARRRGVRLWTKGLL